MRAYKRAITAAGGMAGVMTVAYLIAAAFAAGDGSELPHSIAMIATAAIIIPSVIGGVAWIVRKELEHLRPELAESIAEGVSASMAELRDRDVRRAAQGAATLTITRIREVVEDVVEERMQHVLAVGRRHGAVLEAQSHHMSGKVHQLPRQPGAEDR